MIAMVLDAFGSPGFRSGWYFCDKDLYAARITSGGASRATFKLS
jgi:hypothetical protein